MTSGPAACATCAPPMKLALGAATTAAVLPVAFKKARRVVFLFSLMLIEVVILLSLLRSVSPDAASSASLAKKTPHRADRLQALAEELGDSAIAIEADVTDRDSLVAAAQRVRDELGGADVLVNNAGVMLLAPFTSDQRAEQRQMVEVNLLGAMTATEVFLDQLRDGGGDLVNISSVAGRTARAGNAGYAAT